MKIKDGAKIEGLDIRMRPVLVAADNVWRRNGQELVVTSGLDGEHSAGSFHYYGRAVDFRVRYFDLATRQAVVRQLKDAIQERVHPYERKRYQVVLKSDHMHVEYDEWA